MNATIINNLKTLLAAVEAQPESQFDLSYFKKDEVCGTLFCTIGLATTMPHFQDLGYTLRAYPLRSGSFAYYAEKNGAEITGQDLTDVDFGPDSYDMLFSAAANGSHDAALGYEPGEWNDLTDERGTANMTDKQLAIKRLQTRINEYEAAQ